MRLTHQQKPIAVIPYERCAAKTTPEGKPGMSVMEHCRTAGEIATKLTAQLPESVRNLLPSNPGLSVSVHDVGKVSPGFALKYFRHTVVHDLAPELETKAGFNELHASIGAATIDHALGTLTLASPLAVAVAAHHGEMNETYPRDDAEVCGGPTWAEERRKLIAQLCTTFNGKLQNEASDAALLAGLTCVSDWIASDEDFYPPDGHFSTAPEQAIRECGFIKREMKKGLSFKAVFGFEPRPVQAQFFERIKTPGVYILEAPMGLGKTEAALYAAYRLIEQGHHHGFYFALPTRLTSDRIHERITEFLKQVSNEAIAPKLAHGTAWLKEYQHGGEGTEPRQQWPWFNPSKRGLLYPYAVGTIDQALLSVMNVKHGFVRLFGLAGKVVILDEVHSYDVYTGSLLDELVRRLQQIGCTVIILSATLSAARRKTLLPVLSDVSDAYPLMSGSSSGETMVHALPAPVPRRINLRMESWDTLSIAKEAVKAAEMGQCVVCIANTVAKAQSWYRAIVSEQKANSFEVGILHSRFTQVDRERIEGEWLDRLGKNTEQRPQGCVLVATQILEQSVDIDADWMLSELAPTDMMLQRMGRLWRHDRKQRPCVAPEFVVICGNPEDCKTQDELNAVLGKENCSVYAPYILLRSYAVWKARSHIILPSDIRELIETTYAERIEPNSFLAELKRELEARKAKLRAWANSAKAGVRGIPTGRDDDKAATRYSDYPTRTVLLVSSVEVISQSEAKVGLLDGTACILHSHRPDFDVTRRLHAQTLSLAAYLLPTQLQQGCDWLRPHFYDTPLILIMDDRGVLRCHNEHTLALRYSSQWGMERTEKETFSIPVETDDDICELNTDW